MDSWIRTDVRDLAVARSILRGSTKLFSGIHTSSWIRFLIDLTQGEPRKKICFEAQLCSTPPCCNLLDHLDLTLQTSRQGRLKIRYPEPSLASRALQNN